MMLPQPKGTIMLLKHLAGRHALLGCVLTVALPSLAAAQVLETETARPLAKGVTKIGGNLEFQTAREGHEFDVPLVFEYGLTNRLELVVEPVALSRIRQKTGARAGTVGDTEITALYLLAHEQGKRPALAFAGEVKVPTAESRLVGTDKPDYAAILIASKRFGTLETHGNVSYTVVGRPSGVTLSNIVSGAVAAITPIHGRWRAFGEVLASSGAVAGSESQATPTLTTVPEAAGQELVGTLGVGVYVHPKIFLSFGVSYDNNGALLFRPGITFKTR